MFVENLGKLSLRLRQFLAYQMEVDESMSVLLSIQLFAGNHLFYYFVI